MPWQHTAVFLPGESHGHRSLAGTVHGVTESDTTEITACTHTQCSVHKTVSGTNPDVCIHETEVDSQEINATKYT